MSTAEFHEQQKYRLAKSMIQLTEGCESAELIRITLKSYFKGYFGENFDHEGTAWVES